MEEENPPQQTSIQQSATIVSALLSQRGPSLLPLQTPQLLSRKAIGVVCMVVVVH